MTLWTRSAQDLLDATTSHQPTPGGGSVAALSGAFGVGLVCMALNITRRKEGRSAALQAPLDALLPLQAQLRELADQDVQVFSAYMAALRLPKSAPEEKQARRAALDAAGEQARTVPLQVARACVQALTHADGALADVHPEVQSDVGAGAALLLGALHASLLTLDINLRDLKGETWEALGTERDALAHQGEETAQRVLRRTQAALRGEESAGA